MDHWGKPERAPVVWKVEFIVKDSRGDYVADYEDAYEAGKRAKAEHQNTGEHHSVERVTRYIDDRETIYSTDDAEKEIQRW